MKLEDQVASLELSKRLKELGVRQESAFYWWLHPEAPDRSDMWVLGNDWRGINLPKDSFQVAAFTVAELGLPHGYYSMRTKDGFSCHTESFAYWETQSNNEADARAKMLIHLIEKGIVKP